MSGYTQRSADQARDFPFLMGYPEGDIILQMCKIETGSKSLMRAALGSVLANAVLGNRRGRATSYSRNGNHYGGLDRYHDALTRTYVPRAVDHLAAEGWIVHEKAGTWAGGGKNQQSRFWASERLIACVGELPIWLPRFKEVLRVKRDGRLIGYDDTPETRRLRHEILELNEATRSLRIEVTDGRVVRLENGYLQVPTKDGTDTFLVRGDSVEQFRQFTARYDARGRLRLDRHGRLYAGFWQNLPKGVRGAITLDGEPTRSLDIANAHLRAAYGIMRADPGPVADDLYVTTGYETPERRNQIKLAVNIAFNDDKGRDHAIQTLAWDFARADHKAETGSEDGARMGAWDIGKAAAAIDAAEKRHAPVVPMFYTGAGLDLMFPESNVQLAVTKAARKRNIPILGVHDEFICPASKADEVEGLIQDVWARATGVACRIGRS